ncbi:MAG: CDP-alcohol phosphatidyltransferase family protein [Pseudomonadota bacterium]
MFDPLLRRLVDPVVDPIGGWLDRRGLSADTVTVVGFAVGVVACVALAFQLYLVALVLIALNRIADGIDGAIARHHGVTDFGGFLDIVCDFIIYSGFILGFAIGRPDMALPAAVLIFAFMGTGSSFLAFAILAARRGITTEARGNKVIYYVGGLAEGGETMAVLFAICLFPSLFDWIAYGFAVVCLLTTASRVAQARLTFDRS